MAFLGAFSLVATGIYFNSKRWSVPGTGWLYAWTNPNRNFQVAETKTKSTAKSSGLFVKLKNCGQVFIVFKTMSNNIPMDLVDLSFKSINNCFSSTKDLTA